MIPFAVALTTTVYVVSGFGGCGGGGVMCCVACPAPPQATNNRIETVIAARVIRRRFALEKPAARQQPSGRDVIGHKIDPFILGLMPTVAAVLMEFTVRVTEAFPLS